MIKTLWIENLNPKGEGSLEHTLNRTDFEGPRIIRNKVAGDIFGPISVEKNGNITLDIDKPLCLRNPPDLHDDTLTFYTDNIILKGNLRIRPGYANNVPKEKRRALNFRGTKGASVEGLSLTWAYDQIVSVWDGATDIRFKRCLIAEGFYDYGNGKYGMGALCGDGEVFFEQCVLAHNKGRNPKINKGALRNNLIYNPGDWPIHIDDRFFDKGEADLIGNVVIEGPQSNNNANWLARADNSELFVYDNLSEYREWFDDNQKRNISGRDIEFLDEPIYDVPDLIPAKQLEQYLLRTVGARPLDFTDQRILNSIRTRTGKQIGNERDVGGYPDLRYRD